MGFINPQTSLGGTILYGRSFKIEAPKKQLQYGYWSKPWHLVNPKIAGLKWMFIPLELIIGFDPPPYLFLQGYGPAQELRGAATAHRTSLRNATNSPGERWGDHGNWEKMWENIGKT